MSIEKLNHKSILKAMFKADMISVTEAKRIDANLLNVNPAPSHPLVGIARSLPSHQETGEKITLEPFANGLPRVLVLTTFI